MMKIRSLRAPLSYLLFSIVLLSCSKKEGDFVGSYTTYYAEHEKEVFTHYRGEYDNLGEIKIELFIDQAKKALSGEATVFMVDKRKVPLDITNLHIDGDTLEFSLESEMLRLQGQKFKGKLVKGNGSVVLGFDSDFLPSNSVNPNPFLLAKKNQVSFYNCVSQEKSKELILAFLEKQEKDLTKKIEGETGKLKKENLEFSLLFVKSLINHQKKKS